MTGYALWLIFVLIWFWPGAVGRWLATVKKSYDAAMHVEESNNG